LLDSEVVFSSAIARSVQLKYPSLIFPPLPSSSLPFSVFVTVVLAHVDNPPDILTEPRDIVVKVVMVALVMLPLSMLRNISKLEKV